MNYERVIRELSGNKDIIRELLTGIPKEEYLWKPKPGKWCLLEIICHLYDEEREDFRTRIKNVLENLEFPLPPIDPPGWVTERKYMEQEFKNIIEKFIMEREWSIEWLRSLKSPNWDNAYMHPMFGRMTAKMFLSNWLAHDYLHIRQILSLKFDYNEQLFGEPLTYAGEW